MAFNINDFRSNLPGGGARGNLFEVQIAPPAALSGFADQARQMTYLSKAAQLPGSTVTPVELNYFGRIVKFPGQKEFVDWETTVINDEDFGIRRFMEAWHELIVGNATNIASADHPADLVTDARVIHYSKSGQAIREYVMVGAWQTEIPAIDLAWDTAEPEEFAVTWAYDWWETVDTTNEPIASFNAEVKLPVFGTIGVGGTVG